MNEQSHQQILNQNSPRNSRNMRSKSRLPSYRQNKPIYLTDGQFSSSDHTNISSSEINIFRIQYQNKIKKLQRQNKQLKQTIITLKTSQFYQLDQQKIKGVIRQNQSLKLKIKSLQSDIKLLDEEVSSLMIQNQYLKRNNKILKQDFFSKQTKQTIHQKHNYLITAAENNKKNNYGTYSYGDQLYEQNLQLKDQSKERDSYKEKQKDSTEIQLIKLLNRKKIAPNIHEVYNEKEKHHQNQQSLESQDKSKNIRNRNKSRYRSSSKSGEKGLNNPFLSNKGIMIKKHKKQSTDILSTSQSQNLKHYSSSGNLLNLNMKAQNRSRQLKMSTSRSPNPYELGCEYTSRRKNQATTQQSTDFKGQYFANKRQKYVTSKKKKGIYYN